MSTSNCPADMFGKPNEGVHATRFLGMAAVDLGATALVAWGLSKIFAKAFWFFFLLLMLLGVALHYHFRVDTTLNKALFGERNNCQK